MARRMSVASVNLTDAGKIEPGKVRLLTLDALDQRTLAAKRAQSQIAALEHQLGGAAQLSPAKQMLVRYAAFVDLFIENTAAQYIGSKNFNPPPEWFTAIGIQRRNLSALGLEHVARTEPPDPFAAVRQAELVANINQFVETAVDKIVAEHEETK